MLTLLSVFINVFKEIRIQRKFVRQNIIPFISRLEEKHQGKLPGPLKQKILDYYCILVPVILGIQFRNLQGQPFSEKDRWSCSLTGLITPLFDDAIDISRHDISMLEKLMFDRDASSADSLINRMLKDLFDQLLVSAPDPEAFRLISKAAFESQANSARQFQTGLGAGELEKITFSKSGNAFLFYYTHMIGTPGQQVKDALCMIAGLHQICNDLFDIHKDLGEGVYTLANTCRDFTAFRLHFMEQLKLQNRLLYALPFRKKDILPFSLSMQFIEARGLIAFDHFIRLEKKDGKGLDWSRYSRKELVIDLDKPLTILRWINYTRKISRMV